MAYLSGSQGSVWADKEDDPNVYDKPLGKVRSWSLSMTGDALEVTSLQETDRRYVPGLRNYTGSAAFYYFPTAELDPGLSSLIRRVFKTRLPDDDGDDTTFNNTAIAERPETIGMKLYMADNTDQSTQPTSKGYYIQFRAVITELSISVGVGEVTSGNMSFQVIGAPQKVEA